MMQISVLLFIDLSSVLIVNYIFKLQRTPNKGLFELLRIGSNKGLEKSPSLTIFRGKIRDFSVEIRQKKLFLSLIVAKMIYKGAFCAYLGALSSDDCYSFGFYAPFGPICSVFDIISLILDPELIALQKHV